MNVGLLVKASIMNDRLDPSRWRKLVDTRCRGYVYPAIADKAQSKFGSFAVDCHVRNNDMIGG